MGCSAEHLLSGATTASPATMTANARAGTHAVPTIDDLREAITRTHPAPLELDVVRHGKKIRLVLPGAGD